MNLLNSVKEVFTDALMDKVSDMLGMPNNTTKSAIDTFLPGLLAGISHKGKSVKGAESILDLIKKHNFDREDSFDLDNVFEKKDKFSGFLEMGSSLLSSLFGNKQSGLLDLLLRKSGLSNKSIGTKLLSFLAPIAFRKIAEIVSKKRLDARGLSSFFSNESKDLLAMVPGLGNLFSDSDSSTNYRSIEERHEETEKSGGGWWKWLLPLLILLGLFWLISKSGCNEKETANTDSMTKEEVTIKNTHETEKRDDVKPVEKIKTNTQHGNMLTNFNVNSNGDIVDNHGKVVAPIGTYGLDQNGNLLDKNQ